MHMHHRNVPGSFMEIFASTYGSGYGPAPSRTTISVPGPLINSDNLKEFKGKYAPGSYLKCTLLQEHVSGAVCFSNMVLDGVYLTMFNLKYFSRLLMINGPGKSRPKSPKSFPERSISRERTY